MLKNFTGADHVYVATGYTDLRKGLDGLMLLVEKEFGLNPFSNSLFLFCGRRCDRIKALYYDIDGFVLLYKRLEEGTFKWPRNQEQVRDITPQQYRWLMDGLKIDQPTAIKPVEKRIFG